MWFNDNKIFRSFICEPKPPIMFPNETSPASSFSIDVQTHNAGVLVATKTTFGLDTLPQRKEDHTLVTTRDVCAVR